MNGEGGTECRAKGGAGYGGGWGIVDKGFERLEWTIKVDMGVVKKHIRKGRRRKDRGSEEEEVIKG